MENETKSAADLLTKLKADRAERERLSSPTRLALIARLVERHGLTQEQAETAADNANARIPDEHTTLVHGALLSMITEQWGQVWQAVQPVMKMLGQAFTAATRQFAEVAKWLPAEPEPAVEQPPRECSNCEGSGIACSWCSGTGQADS